ncbi:MAG: alpha/beta fold hydrolase [Acidimicrobiales bacterium]
MPKPSLTLLALESRAVPEFGAFIGAVPALLPFAPRGNGRPVLLLPGFMASDTSTAPIRWYLDKLGYSSYGWNIGRNVGPTDFILDALAGRIQELVEQHEQPLSIVGWSLGGIYAREFARLAPDHVRDVITLGSPFQMEDPQTSNAAPLHELLRAQYSHNVVLPRIPDKTREDLPVPSTAVFSRSDGIVNWDHCVDVPCRRRENIEVYGSHCGLGHNPAVLFLVADRLAQSPESWKPFRAPRALRHIFPDSSHVTAR